MQWESWYGPCQNQLCDYFLVWSRKLKAKWIAKTSGKKLTVETAFHPEQKKVSTHFALETKWRYSLLYYYKNAYIHSAWVPVHTKEKKIDGTGNSHSSVNGKSSLCVHIWISLPNNNDLGKLTIRKTICATDGEYLSRICPVVFLELLPLINNSLVPRNVEMMGEFFGSIQLIRVSQLQVIPPIVICCQGFSRLFENAFHHLVWIGKPNSDYSVKSLVEVELTSFAWRISIC